MALLVFQPQLGQGLLVQPAKMAPGMESSARAVEVEQVVSAHILGSPPMLLLQEDEVRLILETLLSTDSEPVFLPIHLIVERRQSCLAVQVGLDQLH